MTATSGVDFTYWNGMSGRFYYAEMMGGGGALFDYDSDGDLDLFLVQGGRLDDAPRDALLVPPPEGALLVDRLLRNDSEPGSIRFVDVTREAGLAALEGQVGAGDGYGMGAVAADFDADGHVDLYVTNVGRNRHLRNRGDGTFADVTDDASGVARWSVPAAAGDFDLDGRIDLFVGNYVEWSPAAEKRCTDELGQPNYCGPLSYAPVRDTLLRNVGGRFEDVSARAGLGDAYGACLGAVVADVDGDGRLDVFAANDATANQLWIGRDGSGRGGSGGIAFEERALLSGVAVNAQGRAEAGMGVALGDADGDLDEDLLIGHLRRETNTLYAAEGAGSFSDRSAESGLGAPSFDRTTFGVAWLDVDNDGVLDLAVANGAVKVIKEQALAGDPYPLHQRDQLFRGVASPSGAIDGGVRFEEWTDAAGAAFAPSRVSRGLLAGDLDGDGDTDLIFIDSASPARVLENRVGQDRSWLGLRLVAPGASASPVDVPGAVATIEIETSAGVRRATRSVQLGSGYATSSDPRLLFGLGELGDGDLEDQSVDVTVSWPGGGRERFESVALGRYTMLARGTGAPAALEPDDAR